MENRLRVRRAELRISQLEVAQKIGVHESKLSRIENGLYEPTPDERAALARVLDTTEPELFPELAASTEGEAR